jgi:hypothetical protein
MVKNVSTRVKNKKFIYWGNFPRIGCSNSHFFMSPIFVNYLVTLDLSTKNLMKNFTGKPILFDVVMENKRFLYDTVVSYQFNQCQ